MSTQQCSNLKGEKALPIHEADQLKNEDLLALCQGKILAIRIPNYYPVELSQLACQKLLNHPQFSYYEKEPKNVRRWGMSFYETVDTFDFETVNIQEAKHRYYAQVNSTIRELRDIFHPYYSPLDRFRLELQEAWAMGANVMNIDGSPMFVGMARSFENGAGALPHQDDLRWYAPDYPVVQALKTQLTANIYLQIAPQGGELEIWQKQCSKQEYEELRLAECYFLDRNQLPKSSLFMKPQVGDLIIFDSTRIHTVHASQEPRINLSCFIGYSGQEQPLTYWN